MPNFDYAMLVPFPLEDSHRILIPLMKQLTTKHIARFFAKFTLLSVLGTFLPMHGYAVESGTKRPNFVFILADDFGGKDLSGEGSSFYETPNLDRLAASGMRFTDGYANCQVCSPSRASIQLGKYPVRHGITDYIGAASGTKWNRNDRVLPAEYAKQLPADDVTIAESLRESGYRTFFAGKWHLGGKGSYPEDHGYEINQGGFEVGTPPGGFFSPYENPKLADGPPGESLPIRLASETEKFIDQHQREPFFAFLSFYSVHAPIQTTHELWKKYQLKASLKPSPPSRFLIDRTLPVRQVQDNPIYAGMIESMDNAIGIVLTSLDRLGLAENTVVIFTSDNGGVSSGDAYATSNLPLRGGKGRQWEGGIREPYYVRAPGVSGVGSSCSTPVMGTDFYPTILELAGLPLNPQQHIDGVSLVPLLKGGKIGDRPLFWHYPHYGNQGGEPSSMVRRGSMKLIHYWEDGRDELYDLTTDLSEKTDMAATKPDVVKALRVELDAWLKSTNAKIPEADPRYKPTMTDEKKKQVLEQQKPKLEKQHADVLANDFQPNADWWKSQPNAAGEPENRKKRAAK